MCAARLKAGKEARGMLRVKQRIFSGTVCEQEVYTVRGSEARIPSGRERFRNEEERRLHRDKMSRRHHARLVNENFDSRSLYCTLTMDNEHEVHTFEEARKIRDSYVRKLKRAAPDARIMIYMGRGKGTDRIHFHMLAADIAEEIVREKWTAGKVVRISRLRPKNFYEGVDHGQDYTGLANYLFDHWTPEQGQRTHRWKATRNLRQPQKEEPTIAKLNYSLDKPPRAPKGYVLVESHATDFGYLYFKYVMVSGKAAGKRGAAKAKPHL